MGDSVEEEAAMKSFLGRFLEEFPTALGPDDPLPLCPLSRHTLSLDELPGESLDLGLRLMAARCAPAALGAMMCHEALAQLLKSDLSPLHCPQQPEAEQDEEKVVLVQSEASQRLFLNQLREVATAWHRGLPDLPPHASSCSSRGRYLLCSVHAIRNTRRKMEDKHVALAEFNQLFGLRDGVDRAYYGVFDGHGGLDAATYAAAHLHVALSQQEALHNDPDAAFKSAFHRTDHMFRGKALRERLRSGSTGVAVLLQGSSLSVAWLGDSQAMLVRRGQPVTLMDPHKPEREDEKQRIEDLGGCIAFMGCWRVNGTYAVSRAIGDFDQKPYVSGDADCSTVQLGGDEDYLLLACDGFFDTVKPEEVPALVLGALRQPRQEDPEEGGGGGVVAEKEQDEESALGESVAQKLVAHAKAAGSNDNITVMVVFLRPPKQLLAEDTTATEATENSSSHGASSGQ